MKKIKYNNKGVTLVELVIILAIMGIVLQLLYSVFFVGSKSFNIGKGRGFSQQDARLVVEFINSELRYINQLNYEQLKGGHSSLEIKSDEDKDIIYSLIKRKHKDENDKEGEIITTINGEGYIYIQNNEEGKMEISFEHEGYDLKLDLILENSTKLNSGVELLSGGDNKIIYYSFTSNTLIEDEYEDEDEYTDEDEDVSVEHKDDWKEDKKYDIGEKVWFGGIRYEAQNSGNSKTTPDKDPKKWKIIN